MSVSEYRKEEKPRRYESYTVTFAENTNDANKHSYGSTIHRTVKNLTESSVFQRTIIVTIFLNIIYIGFDVQIRSKSVYFVIADYIFLAIYTIEFLLKIYAARIHYFYSMYNVFDFFVLLISYIGLFIGKSEFTAANLLRALRALRAFQTVSYIKGLQVLVQALVDTLKNSVLNVIFLLVLWMYIFAVFGYFLFGQPASGDKINWGSLDRAMFTLCTILTLDGWIAFQAQIAKTEIFGGTLFIIIFIILGHFIMTNVFVAVIIGNIEVATLEVKRKQQMERTTIVQRKRALMRKRQQKEISRLLDKQAQRGRLGDFPEMVQEFQKTLKVDDYVIKRDAATNMIWIKTFLKTLNHQDISFHRLQQLNYEMGHVLTMALERQQLGGKEHNEGTHSEPQGITDKKSI